MSLIDTKFKDAFLTEYLKLDMIVTKRKENEVK